MKAASYFLIALTVAGWIAWLVLPRWSLGVCLFAFTCVGISGMFYPRGVLQWAKTAHPDIDPDDISIWWLPRFIGGSVLVMVLLITIRLKWH